MKTASAPALPLTATLRPDSPAELRAVVRDCYERDIAMYPLGGQTSLDFGLPGQREGVGISLTGLGRTIDYPARDMTITVEAGVTVRALAETLARERQQLPIDVPQADRATVGGVVATNFNGPRRYGHGTVRDYVIGIAAVDGTGLAFQGGGRVVKNVAGYDFCKLLTGSLGTLGIISQVTLKVKPLAEKTAFATAVVDATEAERLLAALVDSQTAPTVIDLLAGPAWRDATLGLDRDDSAARSYALVVGYEGTTVEVDWQLNRLTQEWRELGIAIRETPTGAAAESLVRRLTEFPAAGPSPLVVQVSVAPSALLPLLEAALELDGGASLQAHAGNGAAIVRFSEFPPQGLSRTLVGKLQPLAAAGRGHVVVLSNPGGAEVTHQSVWGGAAPFWLMGEVKQQFDPRRLLNPGRFVY